MDLKTIVFVLFRYKVGIAAFVVASLAIAAGLLSLQTPTYEASAQILVKTGREISTPSQDILEGGGFVQQKRREDIFAEVEILESRVLREKVVEVIGADALLHGLPDEDDEASSEDEAADDEAPSGLRQAIGSVLALLRGSDDDEPELTPEQEALDVLNAGVVIEAVIRSDTIRIRYANEDPDLALLVVETMLGTFLERHIQVHQSSHMEGVFIAEVERHEAALVDLEQRIALLDEDRNVFSIETQRAELIRQRSATDADLDDTRRAILTQRRKVERIESQLASGGIIELPRTSDQSAGIDKIRSQIVELELERQNLLSTYRASSREVTSVTSEIDRAKELLATEQERILFTNQQDLKDLELREQTLAADLTSYDERLHAMNSADSERSRLEREHTIAERNYLLYVNELEQSRISAVMDLARITNVRVIQPASVSSRPSQVSKVVVLTIVLILAGGAGVVLAFLMDYLDQSIKTSRDIELRLGLPVLGSIGELAASEIPGAGSGRRR